MLARLNRRLKGLRTYLAALALMVPDALQQLGALDFSAVLPADWASRVGLVLMVLRIVAGALIAARIAPKPAGGEQG